jgi:hypothetical protein
VGVLWEGPETRVFENWLRTQHLEDFRCCFNWPKFCYKMWGWFGLLHFTEVCSFRKFLKVLIEAVCQQLLWFQYRRSLQQPTEPQKAIISQSGNWRLFIEPEGSMILGSRHRIFETSALTAGFTTLIRSFPSMFRDSASVKTLRSNPEKRRPRTQHFFVMFSRIDHYTYVSCFQFKKS